MQDVYTGPDDMDGPQVLRWDTGKHIDDGGRPTVEVLQDMFQIAFDYSKFSSSSGLGIRQPMPPDVFSDHSLPQLPGLPIDGNADPSMARPLTTATEEGRAMASSIDWAPGDRCLGS